MEVSSKEKVMCKVCDETMRKDMIERHWTRKHDDRLKQGEKSGWKHLSVQGQSSLFKNGFVANKQSQPTHKIHDELEQNLDTNFNPESSFDEEAEAFGESSGVTVKRSIVDTDENSNKRLKEDASDRVLETMPLISVKNLVSLMRNLHYWI